MVIAPWILILTLSTSDGEAIDHIGFATEQACKKAGKEWANSHANGIYTDVMCVSTRGTNDTKADE